MSAKHVEFIRHIEKTHLLASIRKNQLFLPMCRRKLAFSSNVSTKIYFCFRRIGKTRHFLLTYWQNSLFSSNVLEKLVEFVQQVSTKLSHFFWLGNSDTSKKIYQFLPTGVGKLIITFRRIGKTHHVFPSWRFPKHLEIFLLRGDLDKSYWDVSTKFVEFTQHTSTKLSLSHRHTSAQLIQLI